MFSSMHIASEAEAALSLGSAGRASSSRLIKAVGRSSYYTRMFA